MDLEKKAKELKKIKGNIRGEGILADLEYARLKKGEKGVRAVEKKLNELGYKIKFDQIKSMSWYPARIDIIKNYILMDLFNWTKKDIFNMANFSPKASFLVKVLVKYFVSAKKSFEQGPKYWRQQFDFGELQAYEYNDKKKRMIFRIKEYKTDPIMCTVFSGYFLRLAQFVLKSKKVSIKETKCVYKGDPFCEQTIYWE